MNQIPSNPEKILIRPMQQKPPALAGRGYVGYASRVFFDYPLQCAHTLRESFIFPLFLSSMSLMNFMSTAAVCSSIMSHSKANYFHSGLNLKINRAYLIKGAFRTFGSCSNPGRAEKYLKRWFCWQIMPD